MKTEWDYTSLADAYLKRPDYADAAIDAMVSVAGVKRGDLVCDVGAGVAHLTLMLAKRGLRVFAVEPNDAMRANGIKRTADFPSVSWFEGTGEKTGQRDQNFDLVTFGSSFNVCDRLLALKETQRILKPSHWFACMWNHRDLIDPIQARIEEIIQSTVPGYDYGVRRQSQTQIIEESGLFGPVVQISGQVVHQQPLQECIEAWRSHATLARQAGDLFPKVVRAIEDFLVGLDKRSIPVPFTTNIWMAQLR